MALDVGTYGVSGDDAVSAVQLARSSSISATEEGVNTNDSQSAWEPIRCTESPVVVAAALAAMPFGAVPAGAQEQEVPDWFSWKKEGAGVAVADLTGDGGGAPAGKFRRWSPTMRTLWQLGCRRPPRRALALSRVGGDRCPWTAGQPAQDAQPTRPAQSTAQ